MGIEITQEEHVMLKEKNWFARDRGRNACRGDGEGMAREEEKPGEKPRFNCFQVSTIVSERALFIAAGKTSELRSENHHRSIFVSAHMHRTVK